MAKKTTNVNILYKVVKRIQSTGHQRTIQKDLTEAQAQKIVKSFPDSNGYMYVYVKQ